jgi:hypothetical protein
MAHTNAILTRSKSSTPDADVVRRGFLSEETALTGYAAYARGLATTFLAFARSRAVCSRTLWHQETAANVASNIHFQIVVGGGSINI